MTDKAKVNKGASKVATTIAKVFDMVSKHGNVITQCVTSVRATYKGNEVPVADEKFIADDVARIRGWSAASAAARKSEVRKIVRNYMTIPEAITLYAKKSDTFTWHEAMQMLTQLNKGSTPRQAVMALLNKPKAAAIPAAKQLTTCLTRISNIQTRSAKIIAFRKDLSDLAAKHGL